MTYKQIEAAREARLWVGQVAIPLAFGVAMIVNSPIVRKGAAKFAKNTKTKVKHLFKKKEAKEDNITHINVMEL